MSDNKITELPNFERDKVAAEIEAFKRNLPVMLERVALLAKYRHAAFKAYIDAGFTEDQALRLCTQ
jgi:hypothetical protein